MSVILVFAFVIGIACDHVGRSSVPASVPHVSDAYTMIYPHDGTLVGPDADCFVPYAFEVISISHLTYTHTLSSPSFAWTDIVSALCFAKWHRHTLTPSSGLNYTCNDDNVYK